MLDIPSANTIEVRIEKAPEGLKLWVNIDGQCHLRAQRIDLVVVEDGRLTLD